MEKVKIIMDREIANELLQLLLVEGDDLTTPEKILVEALRNAEVDDGD